MTDTAALRLHSLFAEGGSRAFEYLGEFDYPWQALPHLEDIIKKIALSLDKDEFYSPREGVWISKGASVCPSAYVGAPTIIMNGAEIRHSAFIRGKAIIGEGAVIGNSSEIKGSVIFDGAQIPHFNYVGDSIIGKKAHLGAGAITSNVKSDKTAVTISYLGERIDTGLRKLGAILGDRAEIGCGTVLNPGCVIGRDATVYPLCSVRGYIPPSSIYKKDGVIVEKSPK